MIDERIQSNPEVTAKLTNYKNIFITITAEMTGSGPAFHQEDQPGNPNKNQIDTGTGDSRIRFRLDNHLVPDARFDASGPFFYCVDNGSGPCPTSFIPEGDFLVEQCSSTMLVVVDFNTSAENYRYRLNFVNEIGQQLDELDPIIINGGGGSKPMMSS